jgi:hypothetical protein
MDDETDLSAAPLPADTVGLLEGLTTTRSIRRYRAAGSFEGAWGRSPTWAVDPPGTAHTSAGPPERD